jgi:hypothetical protein
MNIKDVNVGCKVRVKQDLSEKDCRFGLNPDMKKFAGKVVTIESIGRTSNGNCSIHIVEDPDYYTWDERCFELKLTAGKGGISRVIFNEPATIVFWDDGEKTVVKCQNDEPYDKEKGLALCYMKKALGNKSNFNNVFKQFIENEEEETFKVGEKVRVIRDNPMCSELHKGDIVTVDSFSANDTSLFVQDKAGYCWYVKRDAIEKIKSCKI